MIQLICSLFWLLVLLLFVVLLNSCQCGKVVTELEFASGNAEPINSKNLNSNILCGCSTGYKTI